MLHAPTSHLRESHGSMHVTVETRKNQNTAPFLQAYGTLIYARSYTLNKLAIIQDMRKADFEKKNFCTLYSISPPSPHRQNQYAAKKKTSYISVSDKHRFKATKQRRKWAAHKARCKQDTCKFCLHTNVFYLWDYSNSNLSSYHPLAHAISICH